LLTISWQTPLQGAAKIDFAATVCQYFGCAGSTWVSLPTAGFGKDPVEMQGHTFDPSGNPVSRSFHIACFPD